MTTRVLLFWLSAAQLPGCTGGSADTDTGWCAVDPLEIRLYHRELATPREDRREPTFESPPACAEDAASTCHSHEDCTAGSNGRCVPYGGVESTGGDCTCLYDDCFQDGECGESGVCACGEVYPFGSFSNNRCQPANCRLDSDCGLGLCIADIVACGSVDPADDVTLYGFACASDQDQCRSDETCWCDDPKDRCISRRGHRVCSNQYAAECE